MVTMHSTLISHLFWGSWAAVQAACSDIDFDFMGYSDLRFDGYTYHKGVLGLDQE
jgi:ethanolamine kinase